MTTSLVLIELILTVIFTVLIYRILNKCFTIVYFGSRGFISTIIWCFFGGWLITYLIVKVIGSAISFVIHLFITILLYALKIIFIAIFIFIVCTAIYCLIRRINPFSITEREYEDHFGANKQDKTAIDSFFGTVIDHIRRRLMLSGVILLVTLVLTFFFGVMAFENSAASHTAPIETDYAEETHSSSQLIDNTSIPQMELHDSKQSEENDVNNSNVSSINLDINAREFDSFCGLWETDDGNVQFRITATSFGYAICAYINPWEIMTENLVMLDNETQRIPFSVSFAESENGRALYGNMEITPVLETGELEISYSFNRQYADPEKALIAGEKRACILMEKEDVPQKADFTQCLGVWNTVDDYRTYYWISQDKQTDAYELRIATRPVDYFDSNPISLTDKENSLSAEFNLGNGVYGSISIYVDRFGQMTMQNAVVYCDDGANSLIQTQNQLLIPATDSEARAIYDDYYYGLCDAISWGDFEWIAQLMLPGSPIYQQQQTLIQNLSSRGISESPIKSEVFQEHMSDLYHYEVSANEIISVMYADGTSKEVAQSYTYILQRADLNSEWLLIDMVEM